MYDLDEDYVSISMYSLRCFQQQKDRLTWSCMLMLVGDTTHSTMSVLLYSAHMCTAVILGDILPSGTLLVSASFSSTMNLTDDKSPTSQL